MDALEFTAEAVLAKRWNKHCKNWQFKVRWAPPFNSDDRVSWVPPETAFRTKSSLLTAFDTIPLAPPVDINTQAPEFAAFEGEYCRAESTLDEDARLTRPLPPGTADNLLYWHLLAKEIKSAPVQSPGSSLTTASPVVAPTAAPPAPASPSAATSQPPPMQQSTHREVAAVLAKRWNVNCDNWQFKVRWKPPYDGDQYVIWGPPELAFPNAEAALAMLPALSTEGAVDVEPTALAAYSDGRGGNTYCATSRDVGEDAGEVYSTPAAAEGPLRWKGRTVTALQPSGKRTRCPQHLAARRAGGR